MGGASDLDRQIEQLLRCEIISEKEVKDLCAKAREILMEESNVQRVDAPVRYVGTFMDSFTTSKNSLPLAAIVQTQIIYLWGILSTEVSIAWKHFYCYWH